MSTANATISSYEETRALLITAGVVLLSFAFFIGLALAREFVLINYMLPVFLVGIGAWLYATHPPYFIGFLLWAYLISPFLRRVLDYAVGEFSTRSTMSVAPVIIGGLLGLTFIRFSAHLRKDDVRPFLYIAIGVLYGFMIGIVKVGAFSATWDLFNYLFPLFIGIQFTIFWQDYPRYVRVFRSVLIWMVPILGTYAAYQYFFAPPWDMFWLEESGMTSSMGKAEATEFRVFSTLNATGPFAIIMMAGLLALFDGKGLMARLSALPGYGSFLLTLVRAAWGGWLVALCIIIVRFRSRLRQRLVVVLLVGAVFVTPAMFVGPIADSVNSRMESIGSLEDDGSASARIGLFQTASRTVLTDPIGQGLGSLGTAAKLSTGSTVNFDSGILAIPVTLGWPGTILFIMGVVSLLRITVPLTLDNTDQFAIILNAIACAFLTMMVFANQITSIKGVIVWGCLGLAVASKRYYSHYPHLKPEQHISS
ncbi:MAG: hypothetical protein HKN43_12545 [Rhodothermales bacterium]|nr:hypothetical protein [Rhodothermales bacterium]